MLARSLHPKELDGLKVGDPIPAAILPPSNPDTAMANMLLKVNALTQKPAWSALYSIPLFNPAIAKWKDRYIVAFRKGVDIRLSWMRHTDSGTLAPIFDDQFLSLHNAHGKHAWNTSVSSSKFREDPRLLVNSKGSMLSMTFVRLQDPHDTPQINYVNLTVDNHTVVFSSEETLYAAGPQKNWIPFEYRSLQYWVTSFNPLHIVKHVATHFNASGEDRLVAVLEDVVDAKVEVKLPWGEEYGLPIRGGTPAIKIRGVYVAFFHTLSYFQKAYDLHTYFMGAITFCPEPPFSIHSMSAHPILQDSLYQGPWHSIWNLNRRDYVVFPAGLAVDDDEKILYMSFGHQDISGFVAEFDIEELWATLELVQECQFAAKI